MWKQLADLFTSVFTLAHRVDRLELSQKEQQREIKELRFSSDFAEEKGFAARTAILKAVWKLQIPTREAGGRIKPGA
ncbi:MAG: hypothetical protein ACRD63_05470 [Pyrinomonadaceae bacterium]